MTIKQSVYAALTTVLANSHAIELPPQTVWPAIVFDIDTTPETGWVLGGGYDQHVINVVSLSRSLDDLDTLRPLIRAALEQIPGYMFDEDSGDAEYEEDPEVYGYFQNFRIRLRTP